MKRRAATIAVCLVLGFAVAAPAAPVRQPHSAAGKPSGIVTLEDKHTAAGLIGQSIGGADGPLAGRIDDILLDRQGRAHELILQDDGLFHHPGTQVAVAYDALVRADPAGDVLRAAPPDLAKKISAYDGSVALPTGRISAAALLRASLVSPDGEKMVNVANLTLARGYAQYVVISFNDLIRGGGDTAAIPFDELRLRLNEDGSTDFLLTANQAKIVADFKARIAAAGRNN